MRACALILLAALGTADAACVAPSNVACDIAEEITYPANPGTSNAIDVPCAKPATSTTDKTMMMWVKYDKDAMAGQWSSFFAQGIYANRQYYQIFDWGSTFGIHCHNGAFQFSSRDFSNTLRDGNWHHLALTHQYSPPELKGYIDGQLLETATTSSCSSTDVNAMPELGHPGHHGKFVGGISNFIYANRILSAAEVAAHKNGCAEPGAVTGAPTELPTAAPTDNPTDSPVTAAPVTTAPTDSPTANPTTATPVKENGWASVSGDPFAKDKDGNKVQFFLPEGELVQLLQCGTVQLYGSAKFSGVEGDHQQWFKRFVVKNDAEESLDVSIKAAKDMLSVNEPMIMQSESTETNIAHHVSDDVPAISKNHAAQPSNLTTLDVAIEGTKATATFAVSYNGFEVDVAQNVSKQIGRGFSEVVQYSHSSGLRFDIESASAKKFNSVALQKLHAHLDLKVHGDLKDCNGGLLAEIWGLVPMSKKTIAMLQEPEKHNQ